MSSRESLGQKPRKTAFHFAQDTVERRKVGTLHAEMNFAPETKAFEAADIPPQVSFTQVRTLVQEVKATTEIDRLGTSAPRWNPSVHSNQHKPYKAQLGFEALKFSIRHGLMDESVTPLRDQQVYIGTDTRNDYTRWNVSTETISHNSNKAVAEM